MNALSTDSITTRLSDAVDAVTSTFDAIDVAAVTDTATDLADAAGTASAVGGRFIVRTVRRTGRVVRRHPKGAAATFAVAVALLALFSWYRRSEEISSSADLKVAA